MHHPFLCYRHVWIDSQGQPFYLGFPLPLTPTECGILQCLILAATDDPLAHVSPEAVGCRVSCHMAALRPASPNDRESVRLHRLFDRVPPPPPTVMSKQQVSVHVHQINEKAQRIGGRRLILSKRNLGYRLNPHM